MLRTALLLPLLAFPLSGCLLVDVNTRSGFYTGGTVSSTVTTTDTIQESGDIYDAPIGGIEYFSTLGNGRAEAYSAILAGSDTGTTPTSGQAVYLADYEVAVISNLRYYETELRGVSSLDDGKISIVADFDQGTVTGSDGALVVDGAITGRAFEGGVVYAGHDGDLEGLVGDQGVIGAFHGNNGKIVFAGGFVGN